MARNKDDALVAGWSPTMAPMATTVPNNSSDETFGRVTLQDFRPLFLLMIPIFATMGNTLVVVTIALHKKLRQVNTNHHILSLAVSDLVIASFVMPFAIFVAVNNGTWKASEALCKVFLATDVAGSTASILNLVLIASDRFMAIVRPTLYQQRWKKTTKVGIAIGAVWALSASLMIPLLVTRHTTGQESTCDFDSPDFMIYSSLLSFYLPALTIVMMYSVIFIQLKKRVSAIDAIRGNNSLKSIGSRNRSEETSSEEEAENPKPIDEDANIDGSHPSDTLLQKERARTQSQSSKDLCTRTSDPKSRKRLSRCSILSEPGDSMSMKHLNAQETVRKATQTLRRLTTGIQTKLAASKAHGFRREKKATKLVAVVVGSFLTLWLPFFTLQIYRGVCLKLDRCSKNDSTFFWWFMLCTWLGYINSALNPVLYTVFNATFRHAMHDTTHCRSEERPRDIPRLAKRRSAAREDVYVN